MNTINIETMQKTVSLFDRLPRFKSFGMSKEPIENVLLDYNDEIEKVIFSTGYLKRIAARVYRDEPSAPNETTWVLGYDDRISAVFVELN